MHARVNAAVCRVAVAVVDLGRADCGADGGLASLSLGQQDYVDGRQYFVFAGMCGHFGHAADSQIERPAPRHLFGVCLRGRLMIPPFRQTAEVQMNSPDIQKGSAKSNYGAETQLKWNLKKKKKKRQKQTPFHKGIEYQPVSHHLNAPTLISNLLHAPKLPT
jgi:hypothetical protein